jgi:hypothetical protein
MKVTVQNCIIDMDMVLKASKQVWPWEFPILQEKHGAGKVQLQDPAEATVERDELPEAAEEYGRLANAHGFDGGKGGTNRPYVELAYGRGRAGIQELAKAIKKAGKQKAVRKAAATKVPKAETLKEPETSGDGDPLDF